MGAMNTAELSSLSTAVDELARRVSGFIDEAGSTKQEAIASDLMEVERALKTASRRLRKLVDQAARK
jgi:ABC-type transporter Mla subunit MlaD